MSLAALLASYPPDAIRTPVWSDALDRMRPLSESRGTERDVEAAGKVLQLAAQRLVRFDAWALCAFIRCAAAFKGAISQASLAAWQRALEPLVQDLNPQGVSNVLLMLGTLADADSELAKAVDVELAARLLGRAVGLASSLQAQGSANALYGAALLRLQIDGGHFAALLSTAHGALRDMSPQGLTQLLLASQKLIDAAKHQEALQPELDPERMYYPGNEVMHSVLEHAIYLQRQQQLDTQLACQSLGACGALRYLPAETQLMQLLAAIRDKGHEVRGHEASAALMGCAKLGVQPGADILSTCWHAVVREGACNGRAVSNVAWALTVLEACDAEMWEQLTALLAANVSELNSVQLHQWHWALLLVAQQHGGTVARPPELFQRSLAAHQADILQTSQPLSHFHSALAEAVRGLAGDFGVGRDKVEVEYAVPVCAQMGWVRVDIAIPSRRLVVEADGPHHYLRNVDPLQETGDTLARNRLLRGAGWDVVTVPHTVFDHLIGQDPSHEHLVAGLREYL
ncbi:hypothetical protein N2152v2_011099 [Parachlorella kessleri]